MKDMLLPSMSMAVIRQGGRGAGDPPLTIPNREVKPRSADGTGKPGEQGAAPVEGKASEGHLRGLLFICLFVFCFVFLRLARFMPRRRRRCKSRPWASTPNSQVPTLNPQPSTTNRYRQCLPILAIQLLYLLRICRTFIETHLIHTVENIDTLRRFNLWQTISDTVAKCIGNASSLNITH